MSESLVQEKEASLARLPGYRPPPLRLIAWLSARTRLPGFVVVLVVCSLPYGVGALIAMTEPGLLADFTKFWLQLNVFMITASAFILFDFIHKRTIEAVEAAIVPMEDPAEIQRIEEAVEHLFCGRVQTRLVAVFSVVGLVTILGFLRLPFEGLLWAYLSLYVLGVMVLLSSGLWAAIGLMGLSRAYGRCTSIRFNLIEPLHTSGVRQMAALSTTWGICFAVQSIFMLWGLWLAEWGGSKQAMFYASSFWSIFMIVITTLTFISPKAAIRNLVLRGKRRGLAWYEEHFHECETRVGEISLMELMRRERALTLLQAYSELQSRISKAPISPLDVPTLLKLAGSVMVPAAVFVSQHPEALQAVADSIRTALP